MRIPEMIAIIQVYIHHATGREVDISPQVSNQREKSLLVAAYAVAANWIKDNNIKLTLLKG